MQEFNPGHVPNFHCEELRDILRKLTPMWDISLGEISATGHRIELVSGAQPIAQHSYRTGQEGREKQHFQVHKMLRASTIEPVQLPLVCPVVLATKSKSSWPLRVDSRLLNAVIVKNVYLIPCMDEYFGSLGETTAFSTLDTN